MLKTVAQRAPHQNLTYDIYGAGPLKTDLEDTIDRLGLRHIVSMKGWCGKPDLLASEYDFYLSTSTFEGFGLSILSGLRGMNVAIITNVGELSKHLCDGKSCFLIDNDEQKASETILKVLSLPEDSLEFVQKNGRDIYISEFGYDAYVSQLKRIYIGHG
jgi:glycosyltransferase involved in cell wall biosynthesis